ncbi:MAG: relaxase/mobilization nuclease domain-containing protein [Anaerotignaceae bacterium]
MATTRIIPMHINKGKTLAQCLADRTDYAKNPVKTNNGELVSSFMCDTDLIDSQFLLSKKIYLQKTGRTQKNDVIAYQVRQSFKPGEITPELANKLGYELAEKITKGNHAFIVATHIDKSHLHNHIIWNSTTLNCHKKFRNFWNSTNAIRKINDLICLKNGLSIVENPKKKSKDYGSWLGEDRPLNFSDKLRIAIDEILLEKPKSFDEFLNRIKQKGYEIKAGKHVAFKSAQQKKFIRLRSLGEGYEEENLRCVIEGKKEHKPQKRISQYNNKRINLVIDLQSKINEKKGVGYERFVKTFNLKQFAKTINYLTENNLLNYEDLKAKSDSVINTTSSLSKIIKSAEKSMTENALLQKNIVNFAKTKDVYEDYRKSGYSPEFKEKNITEILLHQAAKKYFKEVGLTKLPKMSELKNQYDNLLAQKKKDYAKYSDLKKERQELLNAKANVEQLLEIDQKQQSQQNKKNQPSL